MECERLADHRSDCTEYSLQSVGTESEEVIAVPPWSRVDYVFHALSHLVLFLTSLFGVCKVKQCFGLIGCSLLFMKGLLGCFLIFAGCPECVQTMYQEMAMLSTSLTIPFLCAEVCMEGGLELRLVLFHLLYPVLQVLFDTFVEWPLEEHMIDISLALSIVVMSSFTLSKRNFHGVILACLYQISLCCMRKFRLDISDIIVGLTCLYLPHTLKSFKNKNRNKHSLQHYHGHFLKISSIYFK